MKKEIRIRNIPEKDLLTLKMISEKYGFTSFNQYMLYQIEMMLQNGALDIYQNDLADDLVEIKSKQSEILELLLKQDIQNSVILNKLETLEVLIKRWMELIEVVDSGQI